ncbi:DUF5794 domain-containing protein [Halobacterium zhouii]|uniref:DUF5794 domain-containing protein n=1 Tax=Halobacterium zhouii TaxID=2902624 RepID=UPI001E4E45B1|nr:DUF5794 domain-containing protein [Halobacterium zhouii]
MSSSRHPIALRLEQQVGGATRLLATVMLLPLVDGIFAALVLAGALETPVGIAQVGLLVFGGSATLAVILAEMDQNPREQATSVLAVGIPLIVIAATEAALAPTIRTVVDIPTFERFAGLVILAIAAKTASSTIGEYLPSPGIIIGLGFVASLQPNQIAFVVAHDVGLMLRAAAAAGIAVAFALAVVALQPYLRRIVDIDRFRFGSAVALGTLALSIFHVVPSNAPLGVFAIAALLAFDPDGENAPADASSDTPGDTPTVSTDAPAVSTDGGNDAESEDPSTYGYPSEDSTEERAPWL